MRENLADVRETSPNSVPENMHNQQKASSPAEPSQSLNELQGRAGGESGHKLEKQGSFDLEKSLDAHSKQTQHVSCGAASL
jgi:hypothetical protein